MKLSTFQQCLENVLANTSEEKIARAKFYTEHIRKYWTKKYGEDKATYFLCCIFAQISANDGRVQQEEMEIFNATFCSGGNEFSYDEYFAFCVSYAKQQQRDDLENEMCSLADHDTFLYIVILMMIIASVDGKIHEREEGLIRSYYALGEAKFN